MKTIIIYESKHHGNTKKVCDRVAAECQVELIEAGSVGADFNWEDAIIYSEWKLVGGVLHAERILINVEETDDICYDVLADKAAKKLF